MLDYDGVRMVWYGAVGVYNDEDAWLIGVVGGGI